MLAAIVDKLPHPIETYYEPFVGGAAVFFHLAAEGRFQRAVLADNNEDLICVYRALQKDVEAVIRQLSSYRYEEAQYYEVRDQSPRRSSTRAARIIYLNKTGFNGLYRVNRAGRFNVPFGRHKNPTICDATNLRAASKALQGVELEVADFEEVCARAKPGDAVYLDPPYVPLSKTSNFTAYSRNPFGEDAHQRLAQVFGKLHEAGVPCVLSNSDTPLTRQLYAEWESTLVDVPRNINSRADRRGSIKELLAVNRPRRSRKRKK